MSVLSLFSLFNAYTFLFIGIYALMLNCRRGLNRLAAGVEFCLAVWAFSAAFFYAAPSETEALFWYKVGSIGWILIAAVAAHFYLILSETTKRWQGRSWQLLFYVPPLLLLARSFLGNEPILAEAFVPSHIGWGWSYVLNTDSVWFWLYLVYLLSYYGLGLVCIYRWAQAQQHSRYLRQARGTVAIVTATVAAGLLTDIVLPAIAPIVPPLFNIMAIVWGLIDFYVVRKFKLMSIVEAVTPELILKTVMDPILLLDPKGIVRQCNQATMDLLKYEKRELLGHSFWRVCKPGTGGDPWLEQVFSRKVMRGVELELIDGQGGKIYAIASLALAESSWDGVIGIVINLHDITKQTVRARQMAKLAYNDKLTGLPNRRALAEHMEKMKAAQASFSMAFIDLDGYKAINDHFGHEIGDLLLARVARQMHDALRRGDFIARMGGDEFVIAFSKERSEFEVSSALRRLRQIFAAPFVIEGHSCRIGISAGISRYPEDSRDIKSLMRIADGRMYEEKISHKKG